MAQNNMIYVMNCRNRINNNTFMLILSINVFLIREIKLINSSILQCNGDND